MKTQETTDLLRRSKSPPFRAIPDGRQERRLARERGRQEQEEQQGSEEVYDENDPDFECSEEELAEAEHGREVAKEGGGGKCLTCGRNFTSFYSAKRHHQTVHAVNEERAVCDICLQAYKNRATLLYHMRTAHQIYHSDTVQPK